MTPARVALVHDWLTGMRGGEKALEAIAEMFPAAPIYTLVHWPGSVSEAIESHEIRTSFIQRLPLAHRPAYANYLPLFPAAIERLDLRGFDFVLSTSHAVAKGAIVPPDALHACYCHTPMRYAWDLHHEYFGAGRATPLLRAASALVFPWLRAWDVTTTSRVDLFLANSTQVARRIRRYYGRDSVVVHGWVDADFFTPGSRAKADHFLVVSALVPYKRIELAIRAVRRAGRRLRIVGSGPEEGRLRAAAGPETEFLGWLSADRLREEYRCARAVLFPGEEDLGLVPLEAQATGTPVVAFARGGALETVRDGEGGILFPEQTVEALVDAIARIESLTVDPAALRARATAFGRAAFQERIREALRTQLGVEVPGGNPARGGTLST